MSFNPISVSTINRSQLAACLLVTMLALSIGYSVVVQSEREALEEECGRLLLECENLTFHLEAAQNQVICLKQVVFELEQTVTELKGASDR